jgi:hypothetical protein
MTERPPIGTRIVERVAALEGADPVELDEPLYDAIDVDALESLLHGAEDRPTSSDFRLEFVYHGYAVVVDGAGEVSIEGQSRNRGGSHLQYERQ